MAHVVVGTTYDLRYVLSFEPSSRQKSIANLRKLKNSEARSEHEIPEVEVDKYHSTPTLYDTIKWGGGGGGGCLGSKSTWWEPTKGFIVRFAILLRHTAPQREEVSSGR